MSNNGQLLSRNRDTHVWRCFATIDKLAKAILATIHSGQTVRTSSLDAMQGDECNYVNELSMRSLVTTSACVKMQPNFGARHDINSAGCRLAPGQTPGRVRQPSLARNAESSARIPCLRSSCIHGARLPAQYGALCRVGTLYQLQVDPWRQVKVWMVCGNRRLHVT